MSEISDGIFEIVDLDSHNGTLVNQARITRKILRHGDRISIGHSEFVFLTGPEDEAALLKPLLGGNANATLTTMPLNRKGMPTDDAWVGRMAGDLAALFKIANVINSTRDVVALQWDLLALIGEVVPAAQGRSFCSRIRTRSRIPHAFGIEKGRQISRWFYATSSCSQAIWERCAVASAAAPGTDNDEHVCAFPWLRWRKTLGVIYLTSPASARPLRGGSRFFRHFCFPIAAITLENSSKLDSLRAENKRLRGLRSRLKGPHRREQSDEARRRSSSRGWRKAIPRC